jgi:hypothetical protein
MQHPPDLTDRHIIYHYLSLPSFAIFSLPPTHLPRPYYRICSPLTILTRIYHLHSRSQNPHTETKSKDPTKTNSNFTSIHFSCHFHFTPHPPTEGTSAAPDFALRRILHPEIPIPIPIPPPPPPTDHFLIEHPRSPPHSVTSAHEDLGTLHKAGTNNTCSNPCSTSPSSLLSDDECSHASRYLKVETTSGNIRTPPSANLPTPSPEDITYNYTNRRNNKSRCLRNIRTIRSGNPR